MYNELIGLGDTINLYAVWTTRESDLEKLSSVVSVGDYVNYPVVYDNVADYNGYCTTYNGWKVLSVEDDGTVNLVSAGIPLTYYHVYGQSAKSVEALTTNFLTTQITDSGIGYRKMGFDPYLTLTEVFTNKYTKVAEDGVTPVVRAMTKEDIDTVYGTTKTYGEYLTETKYNGLFRINEYYWLGSADSSSSLWGVCYGGNLSSGNYVEHGVRPVVSLKSEVRHNGKNEIGAWNIEVPED